MKRRATTEKFENILEHYNRQLKIKREKRELAEDQEKAAARAEAAKEPAPPAAMPAPEPTPVVEPTPPMLPKPTPPPSPDVRQLSTCKQPWWRARYSRHGGRVAPGRHPLD